MFTYSHSNNICKILQIISSYWSAIVIQKHNLMEKHFDRSLYSVFSSWFLVCIHKYIGFEKMVGGTGHGMKKNQSNGCGIKNNTI